MQLGRRQSGYPAKATAGRTVFRIKGGKPDVSQGFWTHNGKPFILALRSAFHFSCATPLVMESGAFYNPSNTALEAEVSFGSNLGAQPPKRTVVFSASECLNIDLHFGNSQEH